MGMGQLLNQTPILRVEGYSKTFVLHEQAKLIPSAHNVSLEVYPGKLTALIGPTGAGKSTVLKGIYRTYLPSSGSLLYRTADNQNIDLTQVDDHHILNLRKAEISFVTQFLHALPRQTTEDIVAQPLLHRDIAKQQARHLACEMLAAMNLPQRLWRISPATFSGGEKQRVNLARGLVSKPRLLLLDEPTASLDTNTTEQVIRQIELLKAKGVAMLAIFHDPNIVTRLADMVVELQQPLSMDEKLEEIA